MPKEIQHVQKVHSLNLKRKASLTFNRRVCVPEGSSGAKNSASQALGKKAMAVTEKAKISAKIPEKPTPQEIKEKIVEYSFWLLKQGYREATITSKTRILKTLVKRGANLYDPESVKEVIAKQKTWSEGRKLNAVYAYDNFAKMMGISWQPPKYNRIRKLPFIPTEKEVDQLIAGCSHKVATFLQLLKETGMRPGEAWNLKWIDLDFANNTVRVTPEKNSNPRILKISNKLISMINRLPKNSEYVFKKGLLKHFACSFRRQRKRIAQKLMNPRIDRITFKTLRHFKATMEYYKTKDILHVMQILGHKNIKNTLIYTHLVNFKDDEYISKVAKTVEEACKLVEAGFEYVCEIEGVKIFKKRK